MTVEVVVPWRGGDPDREAAWEWAGRKWQTLGWKVTVAKAPPGEWCKAEAVTPAVRRSSADIIVVADADVWCGAVSLAVDAVRGGAPWAMPHLMVHRLTREATTPVLAGGPLDGELAEVPYVGHEGGGIVALPRTTYLRVPLDPRFKGWGNEDDAWGIALYRTVGPPWRGRDPLWHLWHEPQARRDRLVGSDESYRLYRRYRQAHTADEMFRLVGEVADDPAVDHHHHHPAA